MIFAFRIDKTTDERSALKMNENAKQVIRIKHETIGEKIQSK